MTTEHPFDYAIRFNPEFTESENALLDAVETEAAKMGLDHRRMLVMSMLAVFRFRDGESAEAALSYARESAAQPRSITPLSEGEFKRLFGDQFDKIDKAAAAAAH